jgi:hypothetical protein
MRIVLSHGFIFSAILPTVIVTGCACSRVLRRAASEESRDGVLEGGGDSFGAALAADPSGGDSCWWLDVA